MFEMQSLTTTPVSAHCESESEGSEVSIRLSHLGAYSVPSVAATPYSAA